MIILLMRSYVEGVFISLPNLPSGRLLGRRERIIKQ